MGGVLGGIVALIASLLLWLRRRRGAKALGSGADVAATGSDDDIAEKAVGDGEARAGQHDSFPPEVPYRPTVYGQSPAGSGGADPYTLPVAGAAIGAAAGYAPTALAHQPQPITDSLSQHGSGVSNPTGNQGISAFSEGATSLPYALPSTSHGVSGSGSGAGGTDSGSGRVLPHPSGWSGLPELQT